MSKTYNISLVIPFSIVVEEVGEDAPDGAHPANPIVIRPGRPAEPVGPDNTLPGDLPRVDNTLPKPPATTKPVPPAEPK